MYLVCGRPPLRCAMMAMIVCIPPGGLAAMKVTSPVSDTARTNPTFVLNTVSPDEGAEVGEVVGDTAGRAALRACRCSATTWAW